MNEKKIAFWALIIAFFGWVGIKPDHFKSVVLWLWELLKTVGIWTWTCIKSVFTFFADILVFSLNVPISIILTISLISFILGRSQFKKALSVEVNGKEPNATKPPMPLSNLTERQKIILLDIYRYADAYKGYEEVMRKLNIDSHMLNQAIDQLIELGYLRVAGSYGRTYPDVSQDGRDEVIQFLENNQQQH
ncbi:MAG: hypothetical protein AB1Y25_02800 [Cycloclasticus sp.]